MTHAIDTTTLAERLRASGLNWLSGDLDRLHIQYPSLFTRQELVENRLGVHSSIVNENIELRANIGELLKENDQLRIVNQRVTESEAHAAAVTGESQQNTITLNEKTAECAIWKKKYTANEEALTNANCKISILAKENAHLYALQQDANTEQGNFENLKNKHANLQADLAALTQTKDKLVVMNNERETQCAAAIQERENTIAFQQKTIGDLQAKNAELESARATNQSLAAENERLSSILGENLKTIDGLRYGVAQLTEVEANLGVTSEERARLNAQLTARNAECDNLKLALIEATANNSDKNALAALLNDKIAECESLRLQIVNINDLQARVSLLAADNERLSVSLVDKIRLIDDWQIRYQSLESLYLNIKETTEQLDYVKKRYETVVSHTEHLDPKLRVYAELRASTAITESSPEIQGLKKSITYLS